ncbi:MAG: hypothetical protein OXC91_01845 [Rhodobacteraceae bacterium]|nr:hypothetical protein [Paracoccaceae bacterium]
MPTKAPRKVKTIRKPRMTDAQRKAAAAKKRKSAEARMKLAKQGEYPRQVKTMSRKKPKKKK